VVAPTNEREEAGWQTREFELPASVSGAKVDSIATLAYVPDQSAVPAVATGFLGQLGMFEGDVVANAKAVKASDLAVADVVWSDGPSGLEAGLTLSWSAPESARHFDVYQIGSSGSRRWLGRTSAHRYSIAPGRVMPDDGEDVVRFGVVAAGPSPRVADGKLETLALLWQVP
jgi:hypothetical protein